MTNSEKGLGQLRSKQHGDFLPTILHMEEAATVLEEVIDEELSLFSLERVPVKVFGGKVVFTPWSMDDFFYILTLKFHKTLTYRTAIWEHFKERGWAYYQDFYGPKLIYALDNAKTLEDLGFEERIEFEKSALIFGHAVTSVPVLIDMRKTLCANAAEELMSEAMGMLKVENLLKVCEYVVDRPNNKELKKLGIPHEEEVKRDTLKLRLYENEAKCKMEQAKALERGTINIPSKMIIVPETPPAPTLLSKKAPKTLKDAEKAAGITMKKVGDQK